MAPEATAAAEKPPFLLMELIVMVLQDSPGQRLTVRGICESITRRFPYYSPARQSWQNSVRRNLHVHSIFRRLPAPGGVPRRGYTWALDLASPDEYSADDFYLWPPHHPAPESPTRAPPSPPLARPPHAAATTAVVKGQGSAAVPGGRV